MDDRPMFFFAGLLGSPMYMEVEPEIPALIAVNDLAAAGQKLSTASDLWATLEAALDNGKPVFLDSGVFNLTNEHMRAHGITMDEALALAPDQIDNFDWLFDIYQEVLDLVADRLWGYVEIDQGGMENKRVTRSRLHGRGLDPIPVYHPLNDGWDYFDELASNFDRICVGNIVQAPPNIRARIIATVTERIRDYPETWIHFLGLTPNHNSFAYPLVSCDSSSWNFCYRAAEHTKIGTAATKRWSLPRTMQSELKAATTLDLDEWRLRRNRDGEVQIVEQHCAMESLRHYYRTLRSLGLPEF
jgi:hypothetical protein